MERISQTPKRVSVLILALFVAFGVGYGLSRLNSHAVAELQPTYISRSADARSLFDPPIAERVQVMLHPNRNPNPPRLIALTFDDGPYPVTTPLLLDRLRDLGVPATFFLIGDDAARYPELTRRIARYGNEIGNHTWSHPDLDRLQPGAIGEQLAHAQSALVALTGERSPAQIMRPPHGRFNLAAIQAIQADGYDVVLWSDAPGDWHPVTADQLAEHMLKFATAPEIALLHSGSLPTIEMLGQVVPRFQAAGYRFVTVSRLVREVGVEGINKRSHIELETVSQRER